MDIDTQVIPTKNEHVNVQILYRKIIYKGEPNMKLSMLEQETTILFNRAEKEAIVYTHEPALKRKLAAMAKENADIHLIKTDGSSVEYTIPKKLVSIRKPIKKKTLAEEGKQGFSDKFLQKGNQEWKK